MIRLARLLDTGDGRVRLFSVAMVVLSSLCPAGLSGAQAKPNSGTVPPVNAEALCSFITGKMQSALPQVPTLCAPVTEAAGDQYALPSALIVSVFSPTDVLEGKLRRAWATVFIQAVQALIDGALNGVCDRDLGCELRLSDSSLSRAGLYYKVWSMTEKRARFVGLDGDPTSQSVYEAWWRMFEGWKSSRSAETKAEAEILARQACDQYVEGLSEDPAYARGGGPSGNVSPPTCSVMLATDSSVFIVIDFPSVLEALNTADYGGLAEAFGGAFDYTAFDGRVIFRSPWIKDFRVFRMLSLRDIEYRYEEARAAGHDLTQAGLLIAAGVELGVSGRHELFDNPKGGARVGMAVVRVTPLAGSDLDLVDLADGSEWSVHTTPETNCKLTVGTEVNEIQPLSGKTGKPLNPSMRPPFCQSQNWQATFVRAW